MQHKPLNHSSQTKFKWYRSHRTDCHCKGAIPSLCAAGSPSKCEIRKRPSGRPCAGRPWKFRTALRPACSLRRGRSSGRTRASRDLGATTPAAGRPALLLSRRVWKTGFVAGLPTGAGCCLWAGAPIKIMIVKFSVLIFVWLKANFGEGKNSFVKFWTFLVENLIRVKIPNLQLF